ncbi:hypothetical protein LEP1GSC050_2771 [Leptospira broomii serovar Hurstbridge str. 5399]|uniref:Uncharacterized protein n=1 Tax=Leptospira broomii serovar Hurstbridge str. 5399 TaxID=1049789 RepID=T0FDA3_9LEPT|nr:hypothetical protein LEP1GSC050_2771 [Leptospira broomii serovar Hurstbridge str. 5399]
MIFASEYTGRHFTLMRIGFSFEGINPARVLFLKSMEQNGYNRFRDVTISMDN